MRGGGPLGHSASDTQGKPPTHSLTLQRPATPCNALQRPATQTLNLFERMCEFERWPCCKLDGSCSIKKRTKMVDEINDPKANLFVFLLSSKVGGCSPMSTHPRLQP